MLGRKEGNTGAELIAKTILRLGDRLKDIIEDYIASRLTI